MSISRLRKVSAAALVTALTASTAFAVSAPAAQAAAPAATYGTTFDYFADVYPALSTGNHVFESVTIERFKYLLRSKAGNFAFLIGDPTDASTQATIGHINAVAKSLGITKIYNFNPRIDGGKLNVFNHNELAEVLSGAGLTYWQNEGPATGASANSGGLIRDLLNQDTTPEFTFASGVTTGPQLFVYNKDRTVEGAADHVVASLKTTKTAADLDTPAKVTAYEAQVRDVLQVVPANQYAVNTQFNFFQDEINRRHSGSYPVAATHGGVILDEADATDGWRVQSLTYPETIDLLSKGGDIPFLFGGTWCHNTRAIIKDVNRVAQEDGIKTVYNLDFSLFSNGNSGTNYDHIRATDVGTGEGAALRYNRPAHLYGDLINQYLKNTVFESNAISYRPSGAPTADVKTAARLQVGHVLTYNKDNVDPLGAPQPVLDQAIRYNDNGSYTEHMTEWWYVAGHDLTDADDAFRGGLTAGSPQLRSQRAFAKEAIGEIETTLGGIAGKTFPSTVSATVDGVPASTLALGSSPKLSVQVSAAGYAPFISLNTANQNADANNGTGKPRGYVTVVNAANQQIVAPVLLPRSGAAVEIQLPALTDPGQELRVVYLGRGTTIKSSTETLKVANLNSVTSLAGPTSVAFGAGGNFTATVTAAITDPVTTAVPSGSVQFNGLPSGPVTATISNGVATAAIPRSIASGTYQVTAQYLGDDDFGTSASQPVALTVQPEPAVASSLKIAAAKGTYGQASTVNIAVTSTKPANGPGKVVVKGATYAATFTNGKASVKVNKALAPGKYTVSASFTGNATVKASVGAGTLTIAKGAPSKVTFKVAKAPTAKKTGKATVTVTVPSGLAKAAGKVSITLKNGKKSAKAAGTVKGGKVSVTLPKLAKGTWKASTKFAGDSNYTAKSAKTVSVKIKK